MIQRNRLLLLFILCLLFQFQSFGNTPALKLRNHQGLEKISASVSSDIELVRERVRMELLEEPIQTEEVIQLVRSLQDNGQWPDINYQDVSNTGFEHSRHLDNMIVMSLAFQQPDSKLYQDSELKDAVFSALGYWLEQDFICDNWWWNQIGTPGRLIDVFLIMDEHTLPAQRQKAAPIIGRAHLDAWGARPGGDRIKIAGILGKAALFNRDTATLRKVIDTMNEEIHFAYQRETPDDKRGLQTDFSFHHRKDRVTSTLSYGLGYAAAFAYWSSKVADTKYHLTEKSMHLLVDFFLDGICKHAVHATYPDPGAKNRSISREATLEAYDSSLPRQLLRSTDYREDELEQVIKVRNGEAEPSFSFNKFFWHTEYMSHQRPNYFASARMFSSRNHTMEVPYNGEGLLNHHLGEGANFISRTGDEYFDIFPVWDWQKIPGTTVVQKPALPSGDEIQHRGLTDFVGGVTDGLYGAAAFDFISPLDSLQARKAWFFFDKEYVCLGSGIRSEKPLPVSTTLNQCYLDGEVLYSKRSKAKKLNNGDHLLNKVNWVLHDSVAYFFPDKQRVRLSNQTSSGSWRRISSQHDSSDEEIKAEVFKLWLEHGTAPESEDYAYIVVPSVSVQEVQDYQKNTTVTILANTPELQALRHTALQITQAAFYEAGTHQWDQQQLSMESPGLIMLQEENHRIHQISISDPSRKLNQIIFSLKGNYQVSHQDVQTSQQQESNVTLFKVNLPEGEYAGQTVSFSLH